jgi:hypothetical protein
MPAGLPGSSAEQNLANPTQGRAVLYDPLSGVKGAPLDKDSEGNTSTGALSTGIGFGTNEAIRITSKTRPATVDRAIRDAGFTDDYAPGAGADSTIMYIGGGRSNANVGGRGEPNPYTNGFQIGSAGDGVDRDAHHVLRMVTAVTEVAIGETVEGDYQNRSPEPLAVGDSVFGVSGGSLLVGPVLTDVSVSQVDNSSPAPFIGSVTVEQS